MPVLPSSPRLVGFSGSLSRPSKTRALVDLALAKAQTRFGGQTESYDLGDLQPALGQAGTLDDLPAPARAVVEAILQADALVLASPVYKGSYTGLFKHLIDLIEPTALRGKPVLLAATGGGDKHALVVEFQLRPLLAFFEAASLPTGIYAGPADFENGQPASAALIERLDRAVAQFDPWLVPKAARAAA
ncbi:FMN reductase [Rhodobacter capsulatus]|uniref:FMN reductase n=1 Tax=Rhodobacter capsulatus TaxID=1061 RepID=UPI004025CB5D